MKTIKDKIFNRLDIICFQKLFDYLRSPQDFTFNIDFTGSCNDFNLPGKRERRLCQDKFNLLVLLQFSWRRGSKDSRGQGFMCLFSKDFISAFNILSISAMSFFAVPNSPISMKPKSPANNICVSKHSTP